MDEQQDLWLLCILFGVSSGIMFAHGTIEINWPNVPYWVVWSIASVTFGMLIINQYRLHIFPVFVPLSFIIFWLSISFSICYYSDLGSFVWPISYALMLIIPVTVTLRFFEIGEVSEDVLATSLLSKHRVICVAVVIDCLLWLIADGLTIHHPILVTAALGSFSYPHLPIEQINLKFQEVILGGSIGFIIFRQINGNLEFVGSFGPTILAISAIIYVGISHQESKEN